MDFARGRHGQPDVGHGDVGSQARGLERLSLCLVLSIGPWFWKIETEDIVISSESEENANWGGSVAWNPTGLTRYAAGTNTADWDFFWVHEVERGGLYAPVDKIGLLAPYIGVASTIVVATVATAIYAKRVKRRKEK